MNIFLSWSGDRSKEIAEKFKSFLSKVVQMSNPFISSQDIDLGAIWSRVLLQEVTDRKFGLIFITPENKLNHWLHYEAGGLIKDLNQDKVVPILFGLSKKDVSTPFSQFQMIEFNKDSIQKLVTQINSNTSNPVSSEDLKELFDAFFPKIFNDITKIIEENPNQIKSRTNEDMLSEILELTRDYKNIISRGIRDEIQRIDRRSRFTNGRTTFFRNDNQNNEQIIFDKKYEELSESRIIENYLKEIQSLREDGIPDRTLLEFISRITNNRVRNILLDQFGPNLFGTETT